MQTQMPIRITIGKCCKTQVTHRQRTSKQRKNKTYLRNTLVRCAENAKDDSRKRLLMNAFQQKKREQRWNI